MLTSDFRFETGSINMFLSRMRNGKYGIEEPLFIDESLINIPGHQPAKGIMFLGCAIDRLAIYEVTLILSDHIYTNTFSHCGLGYVADITVQRRYFSSSCKSYDVCCVCRPMTW